MKRLTTVAVALTMLIAVTTESALADHWHHGRSRSSFGISVNYGNGFNNVGVSYGRGYPISRPYSGYGYGGWAPIYNPYPTYSVPVYGFPGYGGGYGGGFGGGYGGHGHHHGHCH